MITSTDPLLHEESWFYPCTDKDSVIPRNFKLAIELHSSISKSPHLEFVFYDFTIDEVVVVEPLEVLGLVQITIEEGDRYITTAIDVNSWMLLKPNMIYLGIV